MQKEPERSIQLKSFQRRLLHVAGSFFLLYYPLPSFLPYHIHKIWILILILLMVASIEFYRFHSKRMNHLDPLLREYEHIRPASYSYFALGSILLLAYFPQYIAIPCILTAAVCDPLIGIMKQLKRKNTGYAIAFLFAFIFFYFFWFDSLFLITIIASFIGASTAIFAEYSSTLWVDDDLLMQLIPAIELYFFVFILERIFVIVQTVLVYAF